MPILLQSCASYHYADKVKMISFDDNFKKGKSVGSVRGEDCTWRILKYDLGGAPTIDKAFRNAQNQAGALESAGFGSDKSSRGKQIRYINNVNTENSGFDAIIFAKNCLVVTGNGYL